MSTRKKTAEVRPGRNEKATPEPRAEKGERRGRLVRSAAGILAQLPGASMAEIATALNVSRATLYRYFPNREGLIRELALVAIRDTDDATAHIGVGVATYHEAFRLMFEALTPLGDRYHFLMGEARVARDEAVAREVERQTRSLRQMIDGAKNAGEVDPSVSSPWLAHVIDALVWVAWSAVQSGDIEDKRVVEQTMDMLWNGIGARDEGRS